MNAFRAEVALFAGSFRSKDAAWRAWNRDYPRRKMSRGSFRNLVR
jgi:hypothetical protein